MKVKIELPLERYDQLRNKCHMSSPEFSVLMNGCIDRRPKGNQNRFIQILCEKAQAQALLGLATRFCPDAIPAIQRALHSRPIKLNLHIARANESYSVLHLNPHAS